MIYYTILCHTISSVRIAETGLFLDGIPFEKLVQRDPL